MAVLRVALMTGAFVAASPSRARASSPPVSTSAPTETTPRAYLGPSESEPAEPVPPASTAGVSALAATTPRGSVSGPQGHVKPVLRDGNGLMIATGASSLVAWSLTAGLIGMVFTRCTPKQSWSRCLLDLETSFGMVNARIAANWVSLGLAIPGGTLRGRYDRARDGVARKRDMVPFIASGAALIGLGVVGQIALRPAFPLQMLNPCFSLLTTSGGPDAANKCFRKRTAGYLVGLQLTASAITAGSGMLAYGLSYRQRRRERRRNRVEVAPTLTANYQGLSLSGTF